MPALTTRRRPSASTTRQTGWARERSSTRARAAPISSRTPTSSSAVTGAARSGVRSEASERSRERSTTGRGCGRTRGCGRARRHRLSPGTGSGRTGHSPSPRRTQPDPAVGTAWSGSSAARWGSRPGTTAYRWSSARTAGSDGAQHEAGRLGDGPRAVVEQRPRVGPEDVVPGTGLDVLARTGTTLTLGTGRGHRLAELGHRRGVPGLVAGLIGRSRRVVTARGGLAEHPVRVVARCRPL